MAAACFSENDTDVNTIFGGKNRTAPAKQSSFPTDSAKTTVYLSPAILEVARCTSELRNCPLVVRSTPAHCQLVALKAPTPGGRSQKYKWSLLNFFAATFSTFFSGDFLFCLAD
jgi:hypothetical protein